MVASIPLGKCPGVAQLCHMVQFLVSTSFFMSGSRHFFLSLLVGDIVLIGSGMLNQPVSLVFMSSV